MYEAASQGFVTYSKARLACAPWLRSCNTRCTSCSRLRLRVGDLEATGMCTKMTGKNLPHKKKTCLALCFCLPLLGVLLHASRCRVGIVRGRDSGSRDNCRFAFFGEICAVKPSRYYSEMVLRFEVIALPRPFNVGEGSRAQAYFPNLSFSTLKGAGGQLPDIDCTHPSE